MQTIAVDFDGVIHAYSKGWHDGTVYDEPVPDALEALRRLMENYAVAVFTTRDTVQVCRWLTARGFIVHLDWEPPFWRTRDALLVTNRKPAALAYIDDRAIRFTDWKSALALLDTLAHLELGG